VLGSALQQLAATRGTATAIVDRGGARSYAALGAEIDALVAALQRLGPPARVALRLPQDGSAIALAAACDRAGITAAYISTLYGEDRAHALADVIGASHLLSVEGGRLVELARREIAPGPRDAPEVLLLSSGTTGAPKCARHTWAGLAGAISARGERAGDRWLLAYPISHFAALQVVAQALLSGATLVIPDDFGPGAALAALAGGVTCLSCTPTYFRRLVLATPEAAWATTRLAQLTLGGEIVDQALLDAARRALPEARIVHIYASTELGAAITVRDGRAGFDAALLDGERFEVRDGELWARRSGRAMLGYAGGAAPAEWVATGDLVDVADGRVRFRGRANEIINVGGFKVSPAEVEAVVREVAGVAEAWVVGHKSSITGQLVKAVLCLAPGADAAQVKRDVAARCAQRLPGHMTPRIFEVAERAETSSTQKLVRR